MVVMVAAATMLLLALTIVDCRRRRRCRSLREGHGACDGRRVVDVRGSPVLAAAAVASLLTRRVDASIACD
jgi:hypothetical protein